ncbi:hypothetical protein MKW98_015468 [Papaver atlanticum]|uniref:Angio-associated migratory cell protein n=1 Tax=Papaver atlanticum TaxID=357466 RepID=A0AAD4S0F9_9MAGN|nr:hypothetical protein MKW98_015468 [Papaver atlanticum]
MHIFTGHTGELYTVACSPTDATLVATGGGDDKGFLWEKGVGDWAQELQGHKDSCTHDGPGGGIEVIHIILKVINSLPSHSDSVECIGISPSHHPFAATGVLDQKLIIWDLERSTARCSCDHEDGVSCLAWLGSSRHVVTGVLDGAVRFSGECVQTFNGHAHAIQSLSPSANLDFLVSVSIDQTAQEHAHGTKELPDGYTGYNCVNGIGFWTVLFEHSISKI